LINSSSKVRGIASYYSSLVNIDTELLINYLKNIADFYFNDQGISLEIIYIKIQIILNSFELHRIY